MTQYTLTISDKQARILASAVELYSRVGEGQWDHLLSLDPLHLFPKYFDRDKVRAMLDEITYMIYGKKSNCVTRDNDTPDEYEAAWDINQVIRHRLAWDEHPEGGHTVDFGEPMQTSKECELAKIGRIEDVKL